MAAQTQTFTMGSLAAKTYGDAPYRVTATSNSGLPITKWESSDPSVAQISSSGLVTIVGAGQTSITASNSGNATYNAGWVARPLNVVRSSASLPTITQTLTYDGNAKSLDPTVLPSGQATEITYRDSSLPEVVTNSQLVYQNGPDILARSYSSLGLRANQIWGQAKYVKLGGTARKLASCDVTLVTWSKYADYLSWANANPSLVVAPTPGVSVPGDSGGYYHPITLSFYDYQNDGENESYTMLTTLTMKAFIPWRPVTLVDGVTAYDFNGYAFRVPFEFPDGVILPDNVWIGVSYNASTVGTAPIGSLGPYDGLNIPLQPGSPLAGATILSVPLVYKDWRWQSTAGNSGPVLRLRTIPTNETNTAPVNAGSYEVKTQASHFGTDFRSTSKLVINKAPLQVNLTHLTQIRDGSPKPVSVSTIPAEVSTRLSYSGSINVPITNGFYPVIATSSNPNYEGQSSATLHIGDSYESWQSATFASSGFTPEQCRDTSDPDGDGVSNLLEYASNQNPLAGNISTAEAFETDKDTLAFTYRLNLNALDLSYTIEKSSDLTDLSSWVPITPLSETTISDDGETRVVKAIMSKPTDETNMFLHLKVNR